MSKEKVTGKVVALKLPDDLYNELVLLAKEEERPLQGQLRIILRDAVQSYKRPTAPTRTGTQSLQPLPKTSA